MVEALNPVRNLMSLRHSEFLGYSQVTDRGRFPLDVGTEEVPNGNTPFTPGPGDSTEATAQDVGGLLYQPCEPAHSDSWTPDVMPVSGLRMNTGVFARGKCFAILKPPTHQAERKTMVMPGVRFKVRRPVGAA